MTKVTRSHNLDGALAQLEHAAGMALTGGGHILAQRMQARAPLDTGRMTRSVYVTAPEPTPDGLSVFVGPTVDYAKYTEEEPWIIGKRPGPKSQIKGATIPWMAPAARESQAEIVQFITEGLRTAVRALG